MQVILISGKAQNGKDTTANIIKDELSKRGKRVMIAHYGDLVKYVCSTFFGWNGLKDESGRTLLQHVGTDVIREMDEDYWVDFIVDMATFFHNEWDYMIIPDTRFPNEIRKIAESFNSVHIRVVRDDFVSPLSDEQQKHPSETALDNIMPDVLIHNYGTIDDLRNAVSCFIKDYKLEEK